MKKGFEVIKHGEGWVDPNAKVIFCPECVSDDIHQYINRQSKWHGPFRILYTETVYTCKHCGCRFREVKNKELNQVDWYIICFILMIILFITFVILLLVGVILYGDQDHLPIPLAISLWGSGIGALICLCVLATD